PCFIPRCVRSALPLPVVGSSLLTNRRRPCGRRLFGGINWARTNVHSSQWSDHFLRRLSRDPPLLTGLAPCFIPRCVRSALPLPVVGSSPLPNRRRPCGRRLFGGINWARTNVHSSQWSDHFLRRLSRDPPLLTGLAPRFIPRCGRSA